MDIPYDATSTDSFVEAQSSAPAEIVGPNGFLIADRPPAGVVRMRGSRWSGDSVTLSGWARPVATFVLIMPALWMLFFMSIAGVLFLALYTFVVLPVALRDVWRRTTVTRQPLRTPPPRP